MDETQYRQAGKRLESWPRTMILGHMRPDGDALGAMTAVKKVIQAAGREAQGIYFSPVSSRYIHLPKQADLIEWEENRHTAENLDNQYDGVVIVDTCSWGQLETAESFLKASRLPKIIVDHHETRDDLSNKKTEDLYLLDPTAASVCTMVHEWFQAMEWPIETATAEALFTGISTDTGWFRFPNTDGRTLRAAADLVERGVRADVSYNRLYASLPAARMRLMTRMLETLEFLADGKLAIMSLTKDMFEQAQATQGDAEDLVNEPMVTDTVVVSVLLTDLGEGIIRLNLRSKSPEIAGIDIDVSAIAKELGGGGHRRAAGARIEGELAAIRQQITDRAIVAINGSRA